MHCNWNITQYETGVKIRNYYEEGSPMAEICLQHPGVGVVGKWWCPVEYRQRIADKAAKLVPAGCSWEVIICFPYPDVEGMEPEKVPGYFPPMKMFVK